ncbi:MAG TPA: mannitol dehydrogenase family protein [Solirubrobacteraceae bacterium]|nr:mannitol dehydrogenase family protein [Solirubrobacteraceae bacterium]
MSAHTLDRGSWPAPARPVRIVHIGIGNFSRAHQAWYTMAADSDHEWGISAFTGRRPDAAEALGPQQGLYTLIERGNERDSLSVIEVVSEVLPGSDLDHFTATVAAAQTALVTLTVTEAGYRPGAAPPQRLATALVERHRRHAGALAIVSCDNLHRNGEVLRERVIAAAEPIDAEAAGWIDREVSFVSTSVDRITPRITDADRALVVRELGLEDAAPVVTEPFSDWILSGEFPAGRPEWELAGARFVRDIEPWELRKLWMLNGAHSLLAFLGLPRGHTTVADAIGDGELVQAMQRFWDLAGPLLPNAAELELDAYRAQLYGRFANARMGYPLAQIAGDGLDKLRQRVVPVIKAAQRAGVPAAPAVCVVRAWARWLIGDPARAGSDQSAELLQRVLGAGGGDDTMRGLLELVGLPELEIE